MELIACKDVSFDYDGIIAIKGLNFTVSEGDYLCIVGENGAGKSTLIKGLLRLKKPASGTVQIKNGLQPNEIGYMPQQTPVQRDFPASVYEVVLSGCLNRMGKRFFYSKTEKDIAESNLAQLRIAHLKQQCYRELSGGQQQRVLLARALSATQKLLLLDEPASGLDPIGTQEFYQLIRTIREERGITVVMVSHDIHSAIRHADHMLHLSGSQVFFGTTEAYCESEVGKRFVGGIKNV